VLVLYFYIYFYFCCFNYSLFFVVYFLVFSVCEGSLGLSILVPVIRSHRNDYFQSSSFFNINVCVLLYFLTPLCIFSRFW
jgi:NADH-ubiquinone oxidoreductase chain 4L